MLTIDSYHGDLGHAYPSNSSTQLVGLCTGLLSCAAVSSASNVGELLAPAIEAVVVSLRLDLCVLRVRELVSQERTAPLSWSALVSGINESEGMDLVSDFSIQKVSFLLYFYLFFLLIGDISILTNPRLSLPLLAHISARSAQTH